MELLIEAGVVRASQFSALMREGNEILAMVVASARSARVNSNPKSVIANPK